MKADVISDSGARGKRRRAWGSTLRRLAALGVTLAGLATAHLLLPYLGRSASFPEAAPIADEHPMPPPPLPELAEVDIRLDLSVPQPPRRRTRARPSLPAAAEPEPLGYEILGEAELAAISQARD